MFGRMKELFRKLLGKPKVYTEHEKAMIRLKAKNRI